VLSDQLPAEAEFVSATTTQGSCAVQGRRDNSVLVCDLGPLNAFQATTVTIIVRLLRADVTLTNTATVQATGAPDPNRANNTAIETTTVLPR
jgi:Domain of unknown function DUF11